MCCRSRFRPPSPPVRLTTPPEPGYDSDYTWLYVCTDFYNKVYAVENDALRQGLLGRYVDPTAVSRVQLDRDDALGERIGGKPKTLWSEFTEAGRLQFQRQTGRDSETDVER